jgi:signal transduction histidine kinase
MFAYNPTSLASHAVGAMVVELVFADVAPQSLRLTWGGLFALLWVLRTMLAWHVSRVEPDTAGALRARLRIWIIGTLATAAMWGWAAWSFYPVGSALQQITLIHFVYTFCVASVPILAPQFALYLGFVGLVYLPAIARVALHHGALGAQTAFMMLVAMAMTVLLGRNCRNAFGKLSRLQANTEALMEPLRAEKAVSDAARLEAEVANRAKTRFFAAASHDLRQPLHAVALFAEALRQRSHDASVIELVNSINASVDALEGLFSEPLDITRIDSGGVEVKPVEFALADIYRKLRLHFEPIASEKGLVLRFRGAHQHVHADPLLVERILRNVLANAIGYTEDGSVLVGCRRRGARLRLQVWGTGPGISDSEQQRIFEEFYQVPGGAAPLPGQTKGLGLGLAIVKRLAALMDEPLSLRSAPGRGTVFTLELPAGKPAPAASEATPAQVTPGLTLGGKLIVVVEDEPAVRSGLQVLLAGWGAQVASSTASPRQRNGRANVQAARPGRNC